MHDRIKNNGRDECYYQEKIYSTPVKLDNKIDVLFIQRIYKREELIHLKRDCMVNDWLLRANIDSTDNLPI